MTARELFARLFGRVRPNDAHADLDDEIATHLEMAIEENLRQGMTPQDARRAAMRRFGGVASAKELVHDQSGLPALDAFTRDVRLAVRGLGRSPGFALVSIGVLALGIGICSAFLSILNGTLLKPAPGIADPDRLFATQQRISYAHFERLRERNAEDLAVWIGQAKFNVSLEQGADAERLDGHIVSPGYFRTLGVEAMLGQTLDALEGDPALGRSVFVSEDFWRTRLGADPMAVGRRLLVNGQTVTLAGVGPPRFLGVYPSARAQIFVSALAGSELAPELDAGLLDPDARLFRALVRLAPGVSPKAAEAELRTRLQSLDEELGAARPALESARETVQLLPAGVSAPITPQTRTAGLALYAVLIGLVLSLTCASLAGLVMARGGARAKEVAIRLSLGASRGHIVRHLLAESLVLATAGGAAGLLAAVAMIEALTRYSGGPSESAEGLRPDLGVALLTFGLSALAAIGFGLLPALGAARPSLTPALKGDASTGLPRLRKLGLRNLFVVAQVAVSLALILVMGALTLGSRRGVGHDPGFDTSKIQVFSIDPRRDGFSAAESARLLDKLADALRAAHDVEEVTIAADTPLKVGIPRETASVEAAGGAPAATGGVEVRAVGPRHLATLQASVVLGRDLQDQPVAGTREGLAPAVLNQAAAVMLFGERDPIGKIVHTEQRTMQVVGVARYGSPSPFSTEEPATAFVPLSEEALGRPTRVIARSPRGLAVSTIATAVEEADPRLSWFDASTLDRSISELERARESVTAMNLGMAGFAFVLACVGLAGVTAQAVERRRKEIGIEIALGARRATVMRGVMQAGAVMTACGIVLGWGAALGLSRALIAVDGQFAEMIPAGADVWWLMLGAPATLASLALAACFVPARRAAAVDPLAVLRAE